MTHLGNKRIALITAVVLSSLLFWGAAKPWLASPLRFSDWTVVLWPAIAVIVMTAVTGTALMLLARGWDRMAAILASWAAFLIFYTPSLWYVSILPLFFWLWYEASRRMQDDLSDRARIRVNATLGRALKMVLLGAFLMVSMAFYLQIVEEGSGTKVVARVISGSVSFVYDNSRVAEELEKLPEFVQGSAKQFVTERIDEWVRAKLGPYSFLAPPALAFALFFVLWALSFVFREFAIWLGVGIMSLLRRTGFVSVSRQSVQAERLSI